MTINALLQLWQDIKETHTEIFDNKVVIIKTLPQFNFFGVIKKYFLLIILNNLKELIVLMTLMLF